MNVSHSVTSAVVAITKPTSAPHRATAPGSSWVKMTQARPPHGVLREVITTLIRALNVKDAYTLGHSRRVARYAGAIAREMGLGSAYQREVVLAGMLHDVGKIGVAGALLTRPGRLRPDEYRTLLEHTRIGAMMLAPHFAHRPMILSVARWHHERFDGSGVNHLAGHAIPLAARIVAVADAFDAMTSARPYRSAMPLRVAVRELTACSGTQFDPACVQAFLRVLGTAAASPRSVGRRGRPVRGTRSPRRRRAWPVAPSRRRCSAAARCSGPDPTRTPCSGSGNRGTTRSSHCARAAPAGRAATRIGA